MVGRELIERTLQFKSADRIPVDIWVVPAALDRYGERLKNLISRYAVDIGRIENQKVNDDSQNIFYGDTFTDSWGCTFSNLQRGLYGEVKAPPLTDYAKLDHYRPPFSHFREGWERVGETLNLLRPRYIIASGVNPFERMQFIRGTENLMCDIAEGEAGLFTLLNLVHEYFDGMVERWIKFDDVDAVIFSDDWGSQKALLISPDFWRTVFKPVYKSMMDKVKKAGKQVFVHSDGNISAIYEDFIELGVDAVNSQIWCMDTEDIAGKYAGRITFWGELSRQTTLPYGSRQDVRDAAEKMKHLLRVNGGGLIGQFEMGPDVPLENAEEALICWNP
jgi:uroporphyrinogen decarboxylase